ncbi:putative acyl-CoA:6-aminopenicillanic-acid-acyltransferase [Moniliophthora roreri MCA 2997]|uniref:Acyl-CoA:6-aminopenicillanic-acid-acyltransferase n=2 Tax=Moniliophthora roreri TaxID=221103 RepID=V2YCI3_MONRO|nr:putative acyl-CoA:6-aminopenicillanic-acid-acyltransferase [Moniliophthora roreri MCA 2997]KAI3614898.1 6-aminopenicillanic-acid-acyltransferase [Moniliophthora roreri]
MPSPSFSPRIELSGNPREIGLEHGRKMSSQIRNQIQVYDAMFRRTSSLDWHAVRTISVEYERTIAKLTPDIYTEMKGIAEGAELDILDIVALNARSEIALGLFSDGCTSLGWKLSTEDIILAQNWDWTPRVKDNLAMVSIEQPDRPKIYMITEAGIVGKIGFNSAGLGVCLNAIRAHPTDPCKLPIHIALRVCLESASIQKALDKLESLGGVASAQHILIADSTGPLALELSPLGSTYIPPNTSGFVTHTNHFLSNHRVNEPPWVGVGSHERFSRINELMDEIVNDNPASISGALLRERIFSDTFNAPASICCQENPAKPIETRSCTLFCIVMRLSTNKNGAPSAEVVWGQPASGAEEKDSGIILQMPWEGSSG